MGDQGRHQKQFLFRVDSAVAERIEALAFLRGDSTNALLREAIEEYLVEMGNNAPIDGVLQSKRNFHSERGIEGSRPRLTGGERERGQQASAGDEHGGKSRLGALSVPTLGLLGPDGERLDKASPVRQRLVSDVREVSVELLTQLATNPEGLRVMPWRRFEFVVAELLSARGYSVTMSPKGADGGVDLYAASRSDLGSFVYLVQCKRQERSPVGVGVVRDLFGRVSADHATAGLVVTTTRFTAPAKEFANEVAFRMALKDFDEVATWLKEWRAGLRSGHR